MIPKSIIQLYNHFKRNQKNNIKSSYKMKNFNESKNGLVQNTKPSHLYKAFSKNISYILLKLYEYPSKKLELSYVKSDHGLHKDVLALKYCDYGLRKDLLALKYLGLITIKHDSLNNDYYFCLTKKGYNFVQHNLLHQISCRTLFPRLSIKTFIRMHTNGDVFAFIFSIIIFMILLFAAHTPEEIVSIWFNILICFLLSGIFISILIKLNSNRYSYTYVSLLSFFKKYYNTDIPVRRKIRQVLYNF